MEECFRSIIVECHDWGFFWLTRLLLLEQSAELASCLFEEENALALSFLIASWILFIGFFPCTREVLGTRSTSICFSYKLRASFLYPGSCTVSYVRFVDGETKL